jgi:hypothetical protein
LLDDCEAAARFDETIDLGDEMIGVDYEAVALRGDLIEPVQSKLDYRHAVVLSALTQKAQQILVVHPVRVPNALVHGTEEPLSRGHASGVHAGTL